MHYEDLNHVYGRGNGGVNDNALIEMLWNINRKLARRLTPLAQKEGLSLTELVVLRKSRTIGTWRVTALAEELCVPRARSPACWTAWWKAAGWSGTGIPMTGAPSS